MIGLWSGRSTFHQLETLSDTVHTNVQHDFKSQAKQLVVSEAHNSHDEPRKAAVMTPPDLGSSELGLMLSLLLHSML